MTASLELERQSGRARRSGCESQSQDRRCGRKRGRGAHALGLASPGHPRSLLSRHSRRPGDRADPDRQGQSVGPPADQLSRFSSISWHIRSFPGRGLPGRDSRRKSPTMKARRSGTNGMTLKGYKPLWAFGHGLSYTQLRLHEPDGSAGRQGGQGQLLDPQYGQTRRQGRRSGLCRAGRLEAGWVGSAEAPWGLRQDRSQAGPAQACRAENRSAPAGHLRGREQQLADQSGKLPDHARPIVRRGDADRGRNIAGHRLARVVRGELVPCSI